MDKKMATTIPNSPSLYYQRLGTPGSVRLLMIQGLATSSNGWGNTFLSMLKEYDVVIFDNRGIGKSGIPLDAKGQPVPFTIQDLANDAISVMNAVGWDRAHIFGVSMGGMIAQQFSLDHQERVSSLILGATYCGGPGSVMPSPMVVESLTKAVLSKNPQLVLKVAYDVTQSPKYRQDPQHWQEAQQLAAQGNSQGNGNNLNVILLQLRAISLFNVQNRLASLRMPVLVMHGTADQMLPVQNGELIASRIDHALLYLLGDVGHGFYFEEPFAVREVLRENLGL
jgi:3-oxoadipate enol-lactonase